MSGFSNPSSQVAFSPVPNAYKYPYLHRALSQMEAGVASDRKLLLVGDSVFYGYGGAGTQISAGIGPAAAIVKYFNGLGITAQIGLSKLKENGGIGNDARWALGAGWSLAGGVANGSWGGEASGAIGSVAAAGNAVYTPGTLADSYDIYYLINPGSGTVNAQASGGAATPLNMTGGRAVGMTTITAAAASAANTVTFLGATVATAAVQVIGVEPWLSTAPTLRVGDAGAIGATASSWIGGAGVLGNNPTACIQKYAPDVVVINLGVNDAFLTFTTAQFLANMTSLINTCKGFGADVIVLPPVPSQSAADNRLVGETGYAAALPALCASLGAIYIDTFDAWGGVNAYNTLNPLGYYTDSFHPSVFGYSELGRVIAAGLLAY